MVAPTGTSRPAWRSTRANATTSRSVSSGSGTVGSRRVDEGAEAVAADSLLVLAVLEDGAERDGDGVLVEGGGVERGDGLGPVDRLGDAGWFVELEVAERGDRGGDLAGQGLPDVGGPDPEDGELPVEVGVVDP